MHNGKIEAKSEGSGKGSEFIVRLPKFSRPIATTPQQKEESEKRIRLCGSLIVDDNRDGADSLALMLRCWVMKLYGLRWRTGGARRNRISSRCDSS